MSNVAIIGPGAIGGCVAAWLCQDESLDVTACARTPFGRLGLETPYGSYTATPKVITSPDEAKVADWVLVCVKTYQIDHSAVWLAPLVGKHTKVAILQNGVEHVESFSEHVSKDRILPVVVRCPSERSDPETIRQRRPASLVVPNNEMGKEFVTLFEKTKIDVILTDDFRTVAWEKLCLNAAGAVMALTLRPAEVAHDLDAINAMTGIMKECIAVGRAEGANLKEELIDSVLRTYQGAPPDSVNSLHADRLHSRPMETDARNGVIVRLGKKRGIEAPFNQMAVSLLEAANRA